MQDRKGNKILDREINHKVSRETQFWGALFQFNKYLWSTCSMLGNALNDGEPDTISASKIIASPWEKHTVRNNYEML